MSWIARTRWVLSRACRSEESKERRKELYGGITVVELQQGIPFLVLSVRVRVRVRA